METYYGLVRTPADAIKLFEACRLGLLPRVQRRLSEKERQSIRSGSVFVWDEREAGMRRWTDGKSWSASRVSGSFLTYREMEGKRGSGFGGGRRGATKTPDSGRGSDEDQDNGEPEGYRYKADGLMKQSFSITTSAGQHLHLIAYYSRPHPGSPELLQPSTDPNLRHINPMKGMYPESSLHDSNPTPALTRAPMVQHSPYMVPQHAQPGIPPQPYPPQYAQHNPSYQWPPSPVATPPYTHHYPAGGYPPQAQQQHLPPPPPHAHQGHPVARPASPPGHYAQPPATYDRAPLPPPVSQHRQPPPPSYPPQHHSPHTAHAQYSWRPEASPRSQHLQAQAAQAVIADPSTPSSARHLQGPLPPVSREYQAHTVMRTPPNRAASVSPPRSSHSDANGPAPNGNKASISALLQPTHAVSEYSSSLANGTNSNNSSPRTGPNMSGLPAPHDRSGGLSHDAKAIQMLDKKFCI